jgi:hypothetical protein
VVGVNSTPEHTSEPGSGRRFATGLLFTVGMLAGMAVVGSWAQPWRFAAGNPNLSGVATGTASARVVGGCAVGDTRNENNCVQ